jgi:uncharacterized protein YjdB
VSARVTATVTNVSVTALADVIRTGRVTKVEVDERLSNACTVTVVTSDADSLARLLRALQAPHDPKKMLAVRDLP